MSQSDRFCQDKFQSISTDKTRILEVAWSHKWQIFHRLEALEITCNCASNEPLSAKLDDVRAAIQTWSVVKQYSAPRQELLDWLSRCWQIENYRNNC